MTFKHGNSFWKMRSRHGALQIFEDPSKMQEAIMEYMDHCDASPLIETKVGFSQGMAVHTDVPKQRVMTVGGLCLFMGISITTFYGWKRERADLKPVIEWAEMIIRDQKFSGAASGFFNANIIARDLGLAEKQVVDMVTPQIVINPPEGPQPPKSPIHGEPEEQS
jgi:hypothetical protein